MDQENLGKTFLETAQKYYEEKDWKNAFEYHLQAATFGNARANYFLGQSSYYGNGVEKSYDKAIEYHLKAAKLEEIQSHHFLICHFKYGPSETANWETAMHWSKIAVQTSSCAQGFLEYGKAIWFGFVTGTLEEVKNLLCRSATLYDFNDGKFAYAAFLISEASENKYIFEKDKYDSQIDYAISLLKLAASNMHHPSRDMLRHIKDYDLYNVKIDENLCSEWYIFQPANIVPLISIHLSECDALKLFPEDLRDFIASFLDDRYPFKVRLLEEEARHATRTKQLAFEKKLLRMGIELGCSWATWQYACYEDDDHDDTWSKIAAKQNHPNASVFLYQYYKKRNDSDNALKYLKICDSITARARSFRDRNKHNVANFLFKRGADVNIEYCQYYYAFQLECGFGNLVKNPQEAFMYYVKSAKGGVDLSWYHIGELALLQHLSLLVKESTIEIPIYHTYQFDSNQKCSWSTLENGLDNMSILQFRSEYNPLTFWFLGAETDFLCMYRIAWAYATGTFGLDKDISKASEWFEKCREDAQCRGFFTFPPSIHQFSGYDYHLFHPLGLHLASIRKSLFSEYTSKILDTHSINLLLLGGGVI